MSGIPRHSRPWVVLQQSASSEISPRNSLSWKLEGRSLASSIIMAPWQLLFHPASPGLSSEIQILALGNPVLSHAVSVLGRVTASCICYSSNLWYTLHSLLVNLSLAQSSVTVNNSLYQMVHVQITVWFCFTYWVLTTTSSNFMEPQNLGKHRGRRMNI